MFNTHVVHADAEGVVRRSRTCSIETLAAPCNPQRSETLESRDWQNSWLARTLGIPGRVEMSELHPAVRVSRLQSRYSGPTLTALARLVGALLLPTCGSEVTRAILSSAIALPNAFQSLGYM